MNRDTYLSLADLDQHPDDYTADGETLVDFGIFVREHRVSLGMTIGQLCRESGLTQSDLSQIEMGHIRSLSLATREKLCKGINTPLKVINWEYEHSLLRSLEPPMNPVELTR